jgi:hypothetical protein
MNLCLFFQQLDLISERPTLLINKNERIKSVWGAFLTIILIALIISFAVNFLIELFGRKNPRLLIYDEMIEKFKTVPLDYENFPIFWSILDSDVESKGEIKNFNSYFETSIILKKYNENGVNFENVPVAFSKCTFENQLLVYRDIFPNNYGVENFNCLKHDKFSTNNPDLKSKISFDIKNTFISFSLKICNKNGNPNASCTPLDANFISKMNNSELKFYFGNIDTNFNIKTESRENPVNKSPIFFSQVLSNTMKYSWDLNLINKRYSTDYGYIFSEIDNYEFYTIDKNYKIWSDLRINGNSTDSTDLEVLSFTLGINNLFRPVYFRTFYKGQNFFAELGGVFNFLFVIAYHLNLVYSAVHLNLTIDNKCKLSYFVEKVKKIFFKNLKFRKIIILEKKLVVILLLEPL